MPGFWRPLPDGDQLDVEHQGGVGGDRAAGRPARPVGELGRDGQLALAADLHPFDPVAPCPSFTSSTTRPPAPFLEPAAAEPRAFCEQPPDSARTTATRAPTSFF